MNKAAGMTTEDIQKALRCCSSHHCCTNCPFKTNTAGCITDLLKAARDLIYHQQKEIDDMHRYVEDIRAEYDTNDTARTEAIKEFAQLVKENLDDFYHTDDGSLLDTVSMVDLLVKEMTEDQKSDPKEIH